MNEAKVTDHHAIIPTVTRPDLAALSPSERQVYDLVARRFLSTFFPPYTYRQVTVAPRRPGLEVHLADFYDQALMGVLVRRARKKWIVVKSDADAQAQRFMVPHQLGHVLLHSAVEQEGDVLDNDPECFFYGADATVQESEANDFAAALLMPPYNLCKAMKGVTSPALLAQIFEATPLAFAYRMGLLGLTNVVPDGQEGVG